MKGKTLIIAGITAAVIIICFIVYNTYSNTEVESEQIAVVFPMDEIVSAEMFEKTITNLYKEMEEAGEMSGDIENEEIEAMDAQMYAIQNVNLREGTAVTTTALRTIQFAEQVHVTGISTNKQWYQVEDTEKGIGYVASNCLSSTKPTQNSSEAQKSNPDGTTDLTNSEGSTKPAPQPQPSGGGSDNTGGGNGGGGTGPGGVDLDAVKAALGVTPSSGQTSAPAGENSGSNHGITMAQ